MPEKRGQIGRERGAEGTTEVPFVRYHFRKFRELSPREKKFGKSGVPGSILLFIAKSRPTLCDPMDYGPGFPDGSSGKDHTCRKRKRCRFDPWVRKVPWRRSWQPTSVFVPGESHEQRSLVLIRQITSSQTILNRDTGFAVAP